MAKALSPKSRIDRVLSGGQIDRPAVSAWRHFYEKENTADDLARSMLDFQEKFSWDFIKINSRASYHVEDWGAKFRYSTSPLVKPAAIAFPVTKKSDWAKIKPLHWRAGALGENLSAGKKILSQAGSDIYCLPTIFSPLSVAAGLVDGEERFIDLLEAAPDALRGALEAITETFSGYAAEFIKMGMAGIFFATTEWATRDKLTEAQYLEFGCPYDLRVLNAAGHGFFNIIHVCKSNNMLPLFRDYPAQVISWNPYESGNLGIGQAAQITDKIFLTGADQNNVLLNGPANAVTKQVDEAIRQVPIGRLIVAPGCALKVGTPDEHLSALADSVKGWKI